MDKDPYLPLIKACQMQDVKRIEKLCKDVLQEHGVYLQDYCNQMSPIKEDDHVRQGVL